VTQLSHSEIVTIFLSLCVLLTMARICGEIARKLNQPAVFGELLAGVILGPTLLGQLAPGLMASIFPPQGPAMLVVKGFVTVAIALFLLVAGMEVDLSSIWRQGKSAIYVSAAGVCIPFALGLLGGGLLPEVFGREEGADSLIFALFLATALSISALPVIARTLMDLNLYRTDLGMLVIASAVVDDITGWIVFAVILGMMGSAGQGSHVGFTISATLLFAGFMLTGGRWLVHRVLPWIQAHTAWPGGVLSFALAVALGCSAFTEWIGVHAVFGAFLAGVAIGDSSHLREQTRTILHQFVSFIFAPLFFASVGLRLNFIEHFDPILTGCVVLVSFAGKVLGCGYGARLGGIDWRESWAIGFAMNARGAMEIILGLLALEHGIIRQRMFVALVVMALVTSLASGPAMRRLLRLRHPRRLDQFVSAKAFFSSLAARTRREAVRELALAAAAAGYLDGEVVDAAVWDREMQSATGMGSRIAVPHARLIGLKAPVVAVGISREGVDFDAPDGEPARLIFVVLTPQHDDGAQVEILADIARKFSPEDNRTKALHVTTFIEFLALLRTLS
jgi:Kef-type K+ transport system membrane component KefB/mannitol/fructose-specific phosphotransferase system IIA component (Ntr-type)